MVGSVRSAIGAMKAAVDAAAAGRTTLVVLSDIRTGLAGGQDEAQGGDAAVAFLFAQDGPVLLDTLGNGQSTGEFLDRWRTPGDNFSRQWEERFGEHAYVPLVEAAVTDAFKAAGITAADVDHLIVAGSHARAVRAVAKSIGARAESVVDDLTTVVGNPGAAQSGLLLADVLDRVAPGQVIVLVTLADGAEAVVFRATDARRPPTGSTRPPPSPSRWPGATTPSPTPPSSPGGASSHREPPRRPDPERPAAPPSFRSEDWKFGFIGIPVRAAAAPATSRPSGCACVAAPSTR